MEFGGRGVKRSWTGSGPRKGKETSRFRSATGGVVVVDLVESCKPDYGVFYPEGEERGFMFWRGKIGFVF